MTTSSSARRLFFCALAVLPGALAFPVGAHGRTATQGTAGQAPATASQSDSAARAAVPQVVSDTSTSLEGAPVVVAGDTLFRLYGRLGPFSPEERAAAAAGRIERLVTTFVPGADSLAIVPRETYSEIVVRDAVIMTVLDTDAAPLGVTRARLAGEYAGRIRAALATSVQRLSLRALVQAIGYAVLATIVLIVLLRFVSLTFPRIYRRLDALRRLRLPALRIQQFEIASAERMSRVLLGVARVIRIAITLVIFYLYVPLVLSFFPWTAPLSRRIVEYAVTPLGVVGARILAFVPNLFYIAVILLVTRYALKVVHAVFHALETGAIRLEGFYPDWADPTYKIVRVLVLAFTAVVIFPYLPGAHTDAFKGISIFLGVIVSLGSSSAVSNVVAGVVLTYTRAFRLGDRVRIADTTGDVTERTLLVTRLRTIKNEEVTIPNGSVLGGQVVNYTTLALERGLVLHSTVTIGYDAPWTQVHELLIAAARRTEHVLAEPSPFVLQTSLDDFYVSYQLNAYTSRPDIAPATYSRLHANIQDAFNAAGVEIMSPHYRAVRDGGAMAVPPDAVPANFRAPSFRVSVEGAAAIPATPNDSLT